VFFIDEDQKVTLHDIGEKKEIINWASTLTISYVFLGKADFMKTSGEKPMNVEWKLQEPMPAYIWKESGKLAVG
jgi:hypothetical protein